jgi:hypothetical protein
MSPISATRLRVVATAQILLGILLLPFSMFFGSIAAPVLALVPIWIIVRGCLMWRPRAGSVAVTRRIAWVSLVFGIVASAYGLFALRAAARSAAAGGGLLGAFGLLPLALGLAIACLAGISLALTGRGA